MRYWVVMAFALAGSLPAVAQPAGRETGTVLNETCYLRRYYRFGVNRYSAEALAADGQQVLGKAGMDRLRRETEKSFTSNGLDPGKVYWREHVLQPMFESYRPVCAAPPRADWAAESFDDRAWVLARGPFQWAKPAEITTPELGQFDESSMDMALQHAFYRGRFVLDAASAAGAMTLGMRYSGGVRAFLNGQEIARGHLPAGELSADAAGDDYPATAYAAGADGLRERTLGPISIPSRLLHTGVNVLGIEIRASRFHPIVLNNPRQANWGGPTRPWPHGRLLSFEVRSSSPATVSSMRRPAGLQVWVADVNQRVESADFLPVGESTGTVRIVAARNGTYSAQIVVGTDKAIASLSISAGELKQVNGSSTLPAAAIAARHMAAFPLEEWTIDHLGDERGLNASFPDAKALALHAQMQDPAKVYVFDRLSDEGAKGIPANSSRPVWISLHVPPSAAAGTYRGVVNVSAAPMPSVSVPVEVEVIDWRLPDPRDFQTWVACEQNPYGVAKHYAASAKGLEWPVTVLFEVGRRKSATVALGVRAVSDSDCVQLADPLAGRWIRYWPNPYQAANTQMPFHERLAEHPATKAAAKQSEREDLRLLYVGWTRARDRVVLASRAGKLAHGVLQLLQGPEGAVVSEPECDEVTWAGRRVVIQRREGTPEPSIQTEPVASDGYAAAGPRDYPPAFILPSESEGPGEKPMGSERIHDRIPVSGDPNWSAVGKAVHAFFCADRFETPADERAAMADGILRLWGVRSALLPQHLLDASDAMREWVQKRWPQTVWHREWPLIHRLPDASIIRGIADLILEIPGGFVLLDHKSFPGSVQQALQRASRYAGQLKAYSDAIAAASRRPVLEAYVHLPVSGLMVRMS